MKLSTYFLPALLAVFPLLLLSNLSSAQAFSIPDDKQLQGLGSLQAELLLNVCADEDLLTERYGSPVKRRIESARKDWPANLCKAPKTSRSLFQWRYMSSALLANSSLIENFQGVTRRDEEIRACRSTACIDKNLQTANRWVAQQIRKESIAPGLIVTRKRLQGPLVELPHLAVRNLKLPLEGQQMTCGSTTMQGLQFYTAAVKVPGKTWVIAQCTKDADHRRQWLLQSESGDSGWSQILVYDGKGDLNVYDGAGTDYPILYSFQKVGSVQFATGYAFDSDKQSYIDTTAYLFSTDSTGLSHAFQIN